MTVVIEGDVVSSEVELLPPDALKKIGIVELRREARRWRDTTGNPANQCFAHSMIMFYNRGTGQRVDPWWNVGVIGAVG